MTLVTFIYLTDMLPKISTVLFIAIIVMAIVSVFSAIFMEVYDKLACKRVLKYGLIGIAISTALICIIPSKTTMYMMGAAVVGEEFIKSETGQKLRKLVESKIDRELEEVSTSVVKEKK